MQFFVNLKIIVLIYFKNLKANEEADSDDREETDVDTIQGGVELGDSDQVKNASVKHVRLLAIKCAWKILEMLILLNLCMSKRKNNRSTNFKRTICFSIVKNVPVYFIFCVFP